MAVVKGQKGAGFLKPYYQKLRELREDHDCSQAEIAAVLGTTQQVYSRYENGINEMPLHHLRTLCLHYYVSADEILVIPRDFVQKPLSSSPPGVKSICSE